MYRLSRYSLVHMRRVELWRWVAELIGAIKVVCEGLGLCNDFSISHHKEPRISQVSGVQHTYAAVQRENTHSTASYYTYINRETLLNYPSTVFPSPIVKGYLVVHLHMHLAWAIHQTV